MESGKTPRDSSGSATMHRPGRPALLAGVEVRNEDVEVKTSLHVAGMVFRVATVLIVLLAAYQCYDWMRDPPPGGAGWSVLFGDTLRLVVVALLLYGAADLADIVVKNHYELRATRILMARQNYLLQHVGLSADDAANPEAAAERRRILREESGSDGA